MENTRKGPSWTSKTEVDLTNCLSVTLKAGTSERLAGPSTRFPLDSLSLWEAALLKGGIQQKKKSGTMTLMAGSESVERFLLPINSHITAIGRGQRLVREQPAKLSFV